MRHDPKISQRRAELEERIEQLIEMLDLLDGDPDLEDSGDDEPSLGGNARLCGTEILHDLEFDNCDDEPWLGRSERIDQSLPEGLTWDPDREMDDDFEEDLGWSNPIGLRTHIREERIQLEREGYGQ